MYEKTIQRHQSFITKLCVVSSLILISVAGIVFIALFSFNHVESLLSKVVAKDMEQVIENARLGRQLSQVLADTNLLISTFSDHEEFLNAEGARLMEATGHYKEAFAESEDTSRILPPLQDFSHKLEAILAQCALINAISRDIQRIDQDFSDQLVTVEQAVMQKMIVAAIEKDPMKKAFIEKLDRLLPEYRQMLAFLTIRLSHSKQAHLGIEQVAEDYEQDILDRLTRLGAELSRISTVGDDLAPLGKGFLDNVSTYKDYIVTLHQAFRTFQEHLREFKRAEQQLAVVMGEIDEKISRSTQETSVEIVTNIQASKRMMVTLSVIILLVLIFLGYYAGKVIRPIRNFADAASRFAEGSLSGDIVMVHTHDEIGVLSRAFQRLLVYMQDIAGMANDISQGNLSGNIQPKSEKDRLGQALLNMLEYLHQIAEVMTKIAEGNLTETVCSRSSEDTFGQAIQGMTQGLRSLIVRIRQSAEQIASTGTTIAEFASQDIHLVGEVKQSVEHLTAIMDDMQESVENVADNMELLSSSVELTSASMSHMTSSIGQIATNANDLTHQTRQTMTYMNETLQALEQVVEHVDTSKQLSFDTNQDAHDGQQAVEQVMSSMKLIRQTVMTSVEAITRFSQRSQDIDSILEVIRNITEQTALLALNASIIAAQAGSHGRGFAVVADEIKSLADGVGGSTKDIAAIVQSLKKDTAEVVHTIHNGVTDVQQGVEHTQQAQDALQKILLSAERSSSVVTNIADTLHHLKQTSHQVASEMKEVERMTTDITTATNEQKATTEQIDKAIGQINNMASQTRQAASRQLNGVQQVLDVASEVNERIIQNQESSHRITQTTEELSSQSALLLNEVDRFKLPAHESPC